MFVGLAWGWAAIVGLATGRESLWVDELHSSWVISGSFEDIVARGGAGNQTPAYFWLLFAVERVAGGTLGHQWLGQEFWLRAPSLLAWALALAAGGLYLGGSGLGTGGLGIGRHAAANDGEFGGGGLSAAMSWLKVSGLACTALVLWGTSDRLQWFYATEARPYALLQLVNLLGWLVVIRLLSRSAVTGRVTRRWLGHSFRTSSQPEPSNAALRLCSLLHPAGWGWLVVWSLLASTAIHLHLTAVLAVACQWLCLAVGTRLATPAAATGTQPMTQPITEGAKPPDSVWMGTHINSSDGGAGVGTHTFTRGVSVSPIAAGAPRGRWMFGCVLAATGVAAGVLPLTWLAAEVWQRRSQWSRFAGDASWSNGWQTLPWSWLLVLVPLAWGGCLVVRSWQAKRALAMRPAESGADIRAQHGNKAVAWPAWPLQFVWLWAGLGPWLIAWMLTALGWAPLMHSRYVLVSAMPMMIWGAISLSRLRMPSVAWPCVVGLAYLTLYAQGTLGVWRRGEFIGPLRGEDWRGACQWLGERIEPGDDVWCASGLIEGHLRADEMTSAMNVYLSNPLRGMYSIGGRETLGNSPPQALVANWREWPRQWNDAGSALPPERTRWIIYRGRAERLEQALGRLAADIVVPPIAFGNVSVAGVAPDQTDQTDQTDQSDQSDQSDLTDPLQ